MFIYHSLKSVRPCEIIVLCCVTTELDGLQCSGYLYLCVPCLMCRKLLNHNGGHDKYSYLSIETDYRLPDLLLHLTRSRDRHSADTDTLQLGDTHTTNWGWGQVSTQITQRYHTMLTCIKAEYFSNTILRVCN